MFILLLVFSITMFGVTLGFYYQSRTSRLGFIDVKDIESIIGITGTVIENISEILNETTV